ncbi:hypothetical protein DPMN_140295 [Dreissena polymorpha]|uniref:C1q domain-containing protein n=1 Tax=Dreissena polymorpha TaxID=45954 RepID=A0A9D4JK93_DREPO|nr:hypothetical protein DPMN_140295 [Dreissena polymorpha]
MFICPMAGLYLFSFEVMVMGTADNREICAWVDLMVSKETVVCCFFPYIMLSE